MTCFHPCYNSTRVKSLMPGMDLSPCKKGLHSSQEETETGFCLFSSSLFISHQGELIEHKEFLIWVTCHSSSSGWGCSISSFVWHSQTHLVQPGQASAELGLTLMALCVWQTLQRGEHKYRLTLGFLLNPFGDWGGGSGFTQDPSQAAVAQQQWTMVPWLLDFREWLDGGALIAVYSRTALTVQVSYQKITVIFQASKRWILKCFYIYLYTLAFTIYIYITILWQFYVAGEFAWHSCSFLCILPQKFFECNLQVDFQFNL